jgi:hypothetical protein
MKNRDKSELRRVEEESKQRIERLNALYHEKKKEAVEKDEERTKIIEEINELGINNKIKGYNFNYFSPDYNIDIPKNSAIFTCASLEQIHENYKDFVDYLISKKPEICIHFEPSAELLNENNLVDKLSIMYFNKRKYLKNYLTYLRQLEKENKIEILLSQRIFGGSYFIEGYPVIIWKVK